MTRRTSQAGVDLIKSFEGFVDHPYKPVKAERHWTWGYGHYGPDVPHPLTGKRISRKDGEILLRRDLRRFEAAVDRLVTTDINENRFSALVAFCFNVGEGAFASSTLLRLVNRRRFGLAAVQFALWVRGAGGVRLLGLVRRRSAEARLFLKRPTKEKR